MTDDVFGLQVLIVGNGAVGKSSMIQRYCRGTFTKSYKKTIGVDFLEKVLTADNGRQVRLMLWDTAGQEEFDAITRAYYRYYSWSYLGHDQPSFVTPIYNIDIINTILIDFILWLLLENLNCCHNF